LIILVILGFLVILVFLVFYKRNDIVIVVGGYLMKRCEVLMGLLDELLELFGLLLTEEGDVNFALFRFLLDVDVQIVKFVF
jgi:hypothetical protein